MSSLFQTIPDGWQRTTLRHLVQGPKNGAWGSEAGEDDIDVVCVRVADFDWSRLTLKLDDPTIRSFKKQQFNNLQLRRGDIVIEKSGGGEKTPVGRVVTFNKDVDAVTSNFVARIRPNANVWNQFFLYLLAAHYMSGYSHQFIKQNTGIQNLDDTNLFRSEVWIPDLSIQREIADFLDRETARIDLLIEKKQRFIEVLKSKLDSKIYKIITSGVHNHKIDESVDLIWQKGIPASWQAKKVKHLFRLVADPAPPNNDFELLSVYTAIGVRPRKDLEERGNKASTTDGYWRVQKGDIIVNKLLAWMGAIGVSEYSGVTSPAYDILRPIRKLEPFYYHYLFRIPRFSSELKRHSRGIMEMRLRLYFENFGRILVPVPPADEQQAIVSALRREEEEHDLLSAKTVQSIDRLKEYRSALITAAVTGQIDVTTYAKSDATDRRLDAIQEEMGA